MFIKKLYLHCVKVENSLRHPFLLIIRLYWGFMLIRTGFGKLIDISSVSSYFEELHIPLPLLNAIIVGSIELMGGISLILGFLSRIFSFLLSMVFLGAYIIAYPDVFSQFLSNPLAFFMKDPFLFLYASLIVLCFGPGIISFDYWLEKKIFGKAL